MFPTSYLAGLSKEKVKCYLVSGHGGAHLSVLLFTCNLLLLSLISIFWGEVVYMIFSSWEDNTSLILGLATQILLAMKCKGNW